MAYFPSNTGFAGAYTPMSTSVGRGGYDTAGAIAASKAMMQKQADARKAQAAPKPPAPAPAPAPAKKKPSGGISVGGPPKPAAAKPTAPTESAFKPSPTPAPAAAPTYNFSVNQGSYEPVPYPSPQLPTPELPPPAATPTAAAPSPAIQALQASEQVEPSPEGWDAVGTPSMIRPGLGDRLPPMFNHALRAVAY